MENSLYTNFFIALLAVVNPIGKVPIWLQACSDNPAAVQNRLALLVTGTATALLLVCLLLGRGALQLFGIDLAAFRIGGGIVVLLLGISMLHGQAVEVGSDEGDGDEEQEPYERAKMRFRHVVVPLAIPILAGPGSISTAILYGSRAETHLERGVLGGILLGVMALVLLSLLGARRIRAVLGEMVLDVQTRLFGLILAGVAAQLIVEGLGEVFPAWVEATSPIAEVLDDAAR